MTTAILLGAGASAAEGAPLQSDLFREYFKEPQESPAVMKLGLENFFRSMFGITSVAAAQVEFPTFEEALGILDLAELRRESLREFPLEARASDNIRTTHQYLVFAMAQVIARKLAGTVPGYHETLVKQLSDQDRLRNTIFISTNYDILIDNAFPDPLAQEGSVIDYGVDFTNFDFPTEANESWTWSMPSPTATKLYKLHGSLNWLYCPTCNSLTLTPGMKGAILSTDDARRKCRGCDSQMTPIIVPPTFYKDMSTVFLSTVWNKAEAALRKVDHLILCGYSFPDADMHIKYLLKRIQTNRSGKLSVTVINKRPHKQVKPGSPTCECCSCSPLSSQRNDEEERRYRRFLGPGVTFADSSFEDFANNPATCFH